MDIAASDVLFCFFACDADAPEERMNECPRPLEAGEAQGRGLLAEANHRTHGHLASDRTIGKNGRRVLCPEKEDELPFLAHLRYGGNTSPRSQWSPHSLGAWDTEYGEERQRGLEGKGREKAKQKRDKEKRGSHPW